MKRRVIWLLAAVGAVALTIYGLSDKTEADCLLTHLKAGQNAIVANSIRDACHAKYGDSTSALSAIENYFSEKSYDISRWWSERGSDSSASKTAAGPPAPVASSSVQQPARDVSFDNLIPKKLAQAKPIAASARELSDADVFGTGASAKAVDPWTPVADIPAPASPVADPWTPVADIPAPKSQAVEAVPWKDYAPTPVASNPAPVRRVTLDRCVGSSGPINYSRNSIAGEQCTSIKVTPSNAPPSNDNDGKH